MEPSHWLEWLKLGPRHYFVVAAASGLVLLLPQAVLTRLGLESLPAWGRPALGGAFVISFALLAGHGLAELWQQLRRWVKWRMEIMRGRRSLQQLGREERDLLRRYLEDDTQTQFVSYTEGVANGLVAKGILYRASIVAAHFQTFAYNIQPWAWQELKRHPEWVQNGSCTSGITDTPEV